MATWHAVPRLLLVALLAVGVAGMHTLGHPSGGGHGGTTHVATHPAPQPFSEAVPESMGHAVGHPAAAAIVAAGQTVLRGIDISLDPSTVCLAILVGFALVALITALAFGSRRQVRLVHHLWDAVALVGRGPPSAVLVGLRLADLSVLRT